MTEMIKGRPTSSVIEHRQAVDTGLLGALRGAARSAGVTETLKLMRDYHSDTALAVWQFMRLINQSPSWTALRLPDLAERDPLALSYLRTRSDGLLGDWGHDYGAGLSSIINVLTLTLLTQGACALELEVNDSLDDVLDLCPVDPQRIRYITNQENGHYLPCLRGDDGYYPMPETQFRYMPLDPEIDDPYGRSLLWPAMEAVFFQVECLRDIKQVAHVTGHPRMHIELVQEIARENLPAIYQQPGMEEHARTWMNGFLDDVATQYESLKPNDALIAWDWVQPSSLDAGKSSYDIRALLDIVDRQVISSLKMLPVLLGRTSDRGSFISNRSSIEWQIFSKTIEALRQPIQTLLSWAATQSLRIQGMNTVAMLSFAPLRTSDRLKDAQAELQELEAAKMEYFFGFKSSKELAMEHVGHPPVRDPDEPALLGLPEFSELLVEDPQAERWVSGLQGAYDGLPPWIQSVLVDSGGKRLLEDLSWLS